MPQRVGLHPHCQPALHASHTPLRASAVSLKHQIFYTLEDPSYSKLSDRISKFMMLVILVSTVAFILESEVCTKSEW